jgi:phosphate starvation-inducible PhoH-like protein
VQRILRKVDDVGFSSLNAKDVVRHRIVAAIVDAYAEFEAKQAKA